MVSDASFSTAGFKHPDRIFGRHTAEINSCYLNGTIRIESVVKRNKNTYLNFGINLGPKRPLIPIGKYL
jgi:hypothetical protein